MKQNKETSIKRKVEKSLNKNVGLYDQYLHFLCASRGSRVLGGFCGVFWTCLFLAFIFFFFLPSNAARRILVPWPGIKPVPFTVEAGSVNHWTTREVPRHKFWSSNVQINLRIKNIWVGELTVVIGKPESAGQVVFLLVMLVRRFHIHSSLVVVVFKLRLLWKW